MKLNSNTRKPRLPKAGATKPKHRTRKYFVSLSFNHSNKTSYGWVVATCDERVTGSEQIRSLEKAAQESLGEQIPGIEALVITSFQELPQEEA